MAFFLSLLQSQQGQTDTDRPPSPSVASIEVSLSVYDQQPTSESSEDILSTLQGGFLPFLYSLDLLLKHALDFEDNIDLQLHSPTNQIFGAPTDSATFGPVQNQALHAPGISSTSFETPYIDIVEVDQANSKVHPI